jgi:hypothetical protein
MNSIIKDVYPLFEEYQSLRDQLIDQLSDEDLAFRPTGGNETLGALCKEMGEVEYAYIQSFKTFRCDFQYRNVDPAIEGSVEKLRDWFGRLDRELKTAIEGLSEKDIQNKLVDRGPNFKIPPRVQLEIYKEALLIFYGKVSVYLKAMDKPLSEQWQSWIG